MIPHYNCSCREFLLSSIFSVFDCEFVKWGSESIEKNS